MTPADDGIFPIRPDGCYSAPTWIIFGSRLHRRSGWFLRSPIAGMPHGADFDQEVVLGPAKLRFSTLLLPSTRSSKGLSMRPRLYSGPFSPPPAHAPWFANCAPQGSTSLGSVAATAAASAIAWTHGCSRHRQSFPPSNRVGAGDLRGHDRVTPDAHVDAPSGPRVTASTALSEHNRYTPSPPSSPTWRFGRTSTGAHGCQTNLWTCPWIAEWNWKFDGLWSRAWEWRRHCSSWRLDWPRFLTIQIGLRMGRCSTTTTSTVLRSGHDPGRHGIPGRHGAAIRCSAYASDGMGAAFERPPFGDRARTDRDGQCSFACAWSKPLGNHSGLGPRWTRFEFLPALEAQFRAGVELYRARMDKEWSITDGISFEIMRERGIRRALAYDAHFEQAGYEALLRRDPWCDGLAVLPKWQLARPAVDLIPPSDTGYPNWGFFGMSRDQVKRWKSLERRI